MNNRSLKYLLATFVFTIAIPAFASTLDGKTILDSNQPVYIEAEQMLYDSQTNQVMATGKVEVVQGSRIVRANEVLYDEPSNIVTANGDVAIVDVDGNVYFAENMELKDDLKEGVIKNFRARLSDGSLIAANSASRENGSVTRMNQAVFSPCKPCIDDPTKDPLWQIKADKVRMDEAEQRITYKDARLEVYGVPVMYTPYFSHPTPDAPSKSGFLTPSWKASNILGATVETPYYFSIKPNMDATITPIVTSREGMIMEGNYRYMNKDGKLDLRGSITNPEKRDNSGNTIDGNEVRGYLEAHGHFNINDYYNWGFDGKRSTDDTFLGRYGYYNDDYLTQQAYITGDGNGHHARLRTIGFQGLRTEYSSYGDPYALPVLDYEYESKPSALGIRYNASVNSMTINHNANSNSRFIASVGAKLPGTTPFGVVYEFGANLRAHHYEADNYTVEVKNRTVAYDNADAAIPEGYAQASYPLISKNGALTTTIEPMISINVSPPRIYDFIHNVNEDSSVVEYSYLNMMDGNRFAGFDRFEQGTRLNYGVRGEVGYNSTSLKYALGRSHIYSANNLTKSLISSDNSEDADYVGMLQLHYDLINLGYRFRLDDGFSSRASSFNSSLNLNPFTIGFDYDAFNDDPILGDREQGSLSGSFHFLDNWTLSAYGRRDFSEIGGPINSGLNLAFQNECLNITTGVNREFTSDRDIKPNTSFLFKVGLKNMD